MSHLRSIARLGVLLLGGCVAATPPAPAYPPLPPPVAETIPKPPPSRDPLVWEPGHRDWTGSAYAWQHGAYVPFAGHGTMWQPGFWTDVDGTYVWVPAHWL